METLRFADSAAFRTERLGVVSNQEIRDEVKSYLAEYRFQLPLYTYNLFYFNGHLRDTYDDNYEPMVDKAARSIERRLSQGKNIARESSEYKGIRYLDSVLQNALLGDHIIWASPPGSKADGYGNYGFIFSGTVDNEKDNKKHISMTAIRIEKESVEDYNKAVETIVGQPIGFTTPEQFLAQPFCFRNFQTDPKTAVRHIIGQEKLTNRQFEFAMGAINPLVEQFIFEAKKGSPKERLRQLFYTIEHMAIRLRTGTDFTKLYTVAQSMQIHPEIFIQQYGMFRPPIVAGSCGPSGSDEGIDTLLGRNIMNTLTGHILSKILGSEEDEYGDLTFTCGECGGKHTRPPHVILTICPTKKTSMKKC